MHRGLVLRLARGSCPHGDSKDHVRTRQSAKHSVAAKIRQPGLLPVRRLLILGTLHSYDGDCLSLMCTSNTGAYDMKKTSFCYCVQCYGSRSARIKPWVPFPNIGGREDAFVVEVILYRKNVVILSRMPASLPSLQLAFALDSAEIRETPPVQGSSGGRYCKDSRN
ncbi:hypothetical protein NDU88_001030 [Pleurodeles waltl]|uniref:Uncharacterized protein n=1 Tax=Pleurodeles waltl TaxID=8319 RepID=A0AAV7LGD0_PLEWA|nr:hypothetical protein NDU88_001030 [Pleurodeles waltl]